jgi:ABC-type multidrug transport system fused ATPase/permease subunit
MKNPDILILNRACSGLPAHEQRSILTMLLSEMPDGSGRRPGIICLPMNPEHAALFDRVIILEGGSLVADGSPDEVLKDRMQAAPVAGAV